MASEVRALPLTPEDVTKALVSQEFAILAAIKELVVD